MDRFDEMRGKNGGGGGIVIVPPDAGLPVKLTVSKLPIVVDYTEGENINLDGLEVVAEFETGITLVVTEACKVEIESPLTIYSQEATVTYENLITSFKINVMASQKAIPNNAEYLFHFDDSLKNSLNSSEVLTGTVSDFGRFSRGALLSDNTVQLSLDRIFPPTEEEIEAGTETNITTKLKNGGELTIEFWFYATQDYGCPFILGWYGNNYSKGFAVYLDGGGNSLTLRYSYNSPGANTIEANLSESILNKWTHFAITFTSGICRVFINGQLKVSWDLKQLDDIADIEKQFYTYTTIGYMDELLIVEDCLYTKNFIVNTVPYSSTKILTKIYLEVPPIKNLYKVGERFTLDGAKIVAVYSNGAKKEITSECVIDGEEIVELYETYKKIKYTYNNITQYLYINISVYEEEPILDLSETKLFLNFDGSTNDYTRLNKPTVIGSNLYGNGKFGQARYFNRIDTQITFPMTEDLTFGESDFTIACWCKITDTTTENNTIITCAHYLSSSVAWQGINLWTNVDNGFCFCVDLDNTNKLRFDTKVKHEKNVWFHIALVRHGNSVKLYLNGKNIGELAVTGSVYQNPSAIWRIGAPNLRNGTFSNEFLEGYIDDLIITKSALWDKEFTPPNKSLQDGIPKQEDIPKQIERLYLLEAPNKINYSIGDTFSLEGAVIKALYDDGESEDVTSKCTIVNDTTITKDTTTMTISYTENDVTKTLEIYISVYGGTSYYEKYGIVCAIDCNNNILDLTGKNNVRTLGLAEYDENGKFANGFIGNGANCIDIPYSATVNLTKAYTFTIAGWYKWDGTSNNVLFSNKYRYQYEYQDSGISVYIQNSTTIKWAVFTSYSSAVVNTTITNLEIPINEWVHFALVRDTTKIYLFMNGKKIGTATIGATTSTYHDSASSWKFGGANTGDSGTNTVLKYSFNGVMDDLIIAKKAIWVNEFVPPAEPFAR